MARARKIIGDINSAEIDHLKKNFNTILLMLQNAKASITAGVTAENVMNAWADGIIAGVDNNPNSIANVVSTGRPIEGIWTTPTAPQRPQMATVDLNKDSDF